METGELEGGHRVPRSKKTPFRHGQRRRVAKKIPVRSLCREKKTGSAWKRPNGLTAKVVHQKKTRLCKGGDLGKQKQVFIN